MLSSAVSYRKLRDIKIKEVSGATIVVAGQNNVMKTSFVPHEDCNTVFNAVIPEVCQIGNKLLPINATIKF